MGAVFGKFNRQLFTSRREIQFLSLSQQFFFPVFVYLYIRILYCEWNKSEYIKLMTTIRYIIRHRCRAAETCRRQFNQPPRIARCLFTHTPFVYCIYYNINVCSQIGISRYYIYIYNIISIYISMVSIIRCETYRNRGKW